MPEEQSDGQLTREGAQTWFLRRIIISSINHISGLIIKTTISMIAKAANFSLAVAEIHCRFKHVAVAFLSSLSRASRATTQQPKAAAKNAKERPVV